LSYSFKIAAKDNKLSVAAQTAEVPDGEYVVNGHEEDAWLSVGVTHFNQGEQVAQATGYARRA
jgi:hypothetical protein